MNTIETIDLTISSLTADLNNGLTWLKKEDVGYGSIQEKYQATEIQIATIKQHPKLINVETIKFKFQIIDDTETKVPEGELLVEEEVAMP